MSLGDSLWEVIDPTPNVHNLFMQFDKTFFWCKLSSRTAVRWSKRMYSCAGICSYELRGGLCDIALSEPLLKLRPRKDLIETLLHEMIHAYLFLTGGDRDRDGHGPMFKSHMHRINKQTGLHISIYHTFNEEVRYYQTHWWRCNGPCQYRKPYFGIVRRSANRTPGPNDYWWDDHKRKCGGTFIKIKEPEKKTNKKQPKKSVTPKPMGDITSFLTNTNIKKTDKIINSNIKTISNLNDNTTGVKTKPNGVTTVVVTKTNINGFKNSSKTMNNKSDVILWEGKGHTFSDGNKSKRINNNNVNETVRNIWKNKQLNSPDNNKKLNNSAVKRSSEYEISSSSPPLKCRKIDDYFHNTSSTSNRISLEKASTVLKDLYGQEFELYQNKESDSKIIAIQNPHMDLLKCPVCSAKVVNSEINSHLDECLNKKEIEEICQNHEVETVISLEEIKTDKVVSNDEPTPSTSKGEIKTEILNDVVDLTECSEEQKCPCCTQAVNTSMDEHLDECLSFIDDNNTIPEEGKSIIKTEVISLDEDDFEDKFDESQIYNETGTKFPCPCCLDMVEQNEMNSHLDNCLSR